ncbi:MAG: choice-of-anchor P family protein [Nocardioides sp.]
MRRTIPLGMAMVLATSLCLLTPTGTSANSSSAKPGTSNDATGFALYSSGFGSRVRGGEVPAGSDNTAFTVIGCTQKAGVMRRNFEAEVTIPGLGVAEGVTTKLWTEEKNGVVSSYSTQRIAKISIPSSDGSLEIRALATLSRAFHDSQGFHTESTSEVAAIVLRPPSGPEQTFAIPTPNEPLLIPDLARIALGDVIEKVTPGGAAVTTAALDIQVFPTDTRATLARSKARINDGIKSGLFKGFVAGTRARGLDDNVQSGSTPLLVMPCQGTRGKIKKEAIARVNLGDQIVVRGLDTQQSSEQTEARATGFERARIAEVNLGDGELVIKGITAQVNVTRLRNGTLQRDAKGTEIARIVFGGETREFPRSGVIEIPGLVRIEDQITTQVKDGIKVVALRITILDGTGAEIDLGTAELRIRKG